jgi:hypothetical protein
MSLGTNVYRVKVALVYQKMNALLVNLIKSIGDD